MAKALKPGMTKADFITALSMLRGAALTKKNPVLFKAFLDFPDKACQGVTVRLVGPLELETITVIKKIKALPY